MKIFYSTDSVFDAVDFIVKNGFVAVHGTKSEAVPYCERIINALEPYEQVEPAIGYTNVEIEGYLYYVFDTEKFHCGDDELRKKIENLAQSNSN